MSPTLTDSGVRSLVWPRSVLATATSRRSVLPNGSHVASTLNQAKRQGMAIRPTMTMPAMTLV